MKSAKHIGGIGWFLIGGFFLILAGGAGLLWAYTSHAFPPEIILAALVVLALSALVMILVAASTVMAALGIADPRYALGMPEGSIRAVIALTLILIFIVGAFFLFNGIEYTDTSTGLTAEQLDTFINEQPDRVVSFALMFDDGQPVLGKDDQQLYSVTLRTEVNEASRNFATQILTIIGTLVGAVSGFYFGNKALATARGMSSPASKPSITRAEPSTIEVSDTDPKALLVRVFGANLLTAAVAKLTLAGETDILADPIRAVSDNQLECTFDLSGKNAGDWNLVVINADGGEVSYKEKFILKDKPEKT